MPARRAAGRIGRSSVVMVASQVSMTLLQGLQFLALARLLGVEQFGRVASVVAFTAALLPLSGLGMANVALMRIARAEGPPRRYLGNALAVAAVSGAVAVAIAVAAGGGFLGWQVWRLVLIFAVSEFVLTKTIDICVHVFYGLERHDVAVLFQNLHMGLRLALALSLAVVESPSAERWAWLHLGGGLCASAWVLAYTWRRVGRPAPDLPQAWRDVRQGAFFALGYSARSVSTDADKAVLARFVSLEAAGAYTAAYRLVYMAYTPVMALLLAVQARVFRAGEQGGVAAATGAVKRVAVLALGYGAGLGLALYFGAPLVPMVLGPDYAVSSEVLGALCLLPLALMVQSVASEALTGANGQRIVGLLHVGAAVLSVGLNLILVGTWSWHGAVAAAYAVQVMLGLSLGVALWLRWRHQRPGGTER